MSMLFIEEKLLILFLQTDFQVHETLRDEKYIILQANYKYYYLFVETNMISQLNYAVINK